MINTPFHDSLFLTNWETFKFLVSEFKQIKAKLYNEKRRKNIPVCSIPAFKALQKISESIQKVLNGRRMKDEKALELFKNAIRKVNSLIRTLRRFGRIQLVITLEKLEQTLVSLLPSDTTVQLELFDVEQYEVAPEKYLLASFRRWRRDAIYREIGRIREAVCAEAERYEQNKIARLRQYREGFSKGVQILQPSFALKS